MNDLLNTLPKMKSGQELRTTLEALPEYDFSIRDADIPTRLMALSELYRVYIPSQMSFEIYSKLYMALIRYLY